jgi:hypothetical protein
MVIPTTIEAERGVLEAVGEVVGETSYGKLHNPQ